MRIQHNIMAMNSYRNLGINNNAISKNLEKLSSGYAINRAGDDAAGLAISEKMRAQITGLDVAQDNAQAGINLVQTAEGALTEVHDMLNRMYELSEQSANGTMAQEDRDQIQKEVDQLKEEINRIADSTNFNGINLLDGSVSGDSQIKNFSLDTTTATKGVYTTADVAALTGIDGLTVDDIGKSFDYTVTWLDGKGNEQTTTVSLTFQGDGKGGVATAASASNIFVDSAGKKYSIAGTATSIASTTVRGALINSLKSDETFSSNFDIAASTNAIAFTAKVEGTAGAKVIGIGLSENTSLAAGFATAMAGDITVTTEAYDSLQKVNVTGIGTAASSGMEMEDILDLVFEIDGHKFLLNNNLTNDQIKALGDDITIITTGTVAAADAELVAAEIGRVTGLEVKAYAAAVNAAGIAAGDIVFGDTLKTSGESLELQIGDTSDEFNQLKVAINDCHTGSLGIENLDVANQDNANASLDVIKDAIQYVSDVRGTLGAAQNRLEHTINNLAVTEENITEAESTVRDTDVAEEMMAYTKNNILIQSAQAMLAQANQVPQGVLQLLG